MRAEAARPPHLLWALLRSLNDSQPWRLHELRGVSKPFYPHRVQCKRLICYLTCSRVLSNNTCVLMDSHPFHCSVTMISRQNLNEQERKRLDNNYSRLLLSNFSLLILYGAFCITPMLDPKCVIFRHQASIQQSHPWRLHSCCSGSSTYDVLLPCEGAIH